jgi:polyhydroxybutyrate depolymerase
MYILQFLNGIMACNPDKQDSQNQNTGVEEVSQLIEMTNGRQTIIMDGEEREYFLYQPAELSADAPLVIVMHGYTSSAEVIEGYSGMNELADLHGFVVAYPQGTIDSLGNAFFNVGYAFHPNTLVDDVAFIIEIVSTLQDNLGLSQEHVFTTGMSNGGEMSYLLACQASDVFSAAASVSGIMFDSFAADCNPDEAVSIFEIHGTEDSVNWYEGDADNSGDWGIYWGIDQGIAFWVGHNNLDVSESKELPDIVSNDGSTVSFDRYWAEGNSTEVWLYRVEGGGHDWPGVWGNGDIQTSEAVWDFFAQSMTGFTR